MQEIVPKNGKSATPSGKRTHKRGGARKRQKKAVTKRHPERKGRPRMASIFLRTVLLFVLLSLIMRVMGKRQIGELAVSELVTTLLISEVAALPIGDPDLPLLNAVVPVLFLSAAEVLVSFLENRFAPLRRAIDSEPTYLIYRGNLKKKALDDNRISVAELLSSLRIAGAPDLAKVRYAVLEQDGQISVAAPKDGCSHVLVLDGEIQKNNAAALGMTEERIGALLGEKHCPLSDVLLLAQSDDGATTLWKKVKETKNET